jgi:hypothetical protein
MLETTTFRKLDLFPSSREGRETPTLLDPLERAKTSSVILNVKPHRQNPLDFISKIVSDKI